MTIIMAAAMAIATVIPTHDQDLLQGSYEARFDRSPYINLSVTTEDNGFSNWGQSVEPGEVRDVRLDDGRVSFTVTRPAGTFRMEGKGTKSRSRGSFDFFPSEPFRREMAALGFDDLTSERLFAFAMGDLSIADVRYIEQMTSDDLTTARLVKMIQHGVTEEFVSGMAAAGFRNLSSGELLNARDHGVTPRYVKNMQRFGYRLSLKEYIAGKDRGVNERQIAEMHATRTQPGSNRKAPAARASEAF